MHAERRTPSLQTSRWVDDGFRDERLEHVAPDASAREILKTLGREPELGALLARNADHILDTATAALARARLKHYATLDEERLRERITEHLVVVTRACATLRAEPVLDYVERLAPERFASRFEIQELQTAFNAIAEALWDVVLAESRPENRSRALAIISTVTGLAKDVLARRYLALASGRYARALDSRRLFQGTQESCIASWSEPDDFPEPRREVT